MKKRIGILEGKPIITGDYNLKTTNEIHISDLKGEGSGSGSGEFSTSEYLLYQDLDSGETAGAAIDMAILMSSKCRIEDPDNGIMVVPTYYQINQGSGGLRYCTYFEIDFNTTVIFGGQVMTILDYFKMLDDYSGTNYVDTLSSVKRITKEQFYSLEA